MKSTDNRGSLVIIGGAEDKCGDSVILKEFVRLAGGADARLVVMTVATGHPQEVGTEYTEVFQRLGVRDVQPLHIDSPTTPTPRPRCN